MIRLRAAIMRGLEHRWLGPVLLVLLVVLLALVLLHTSAGHADAPSGLVCLAVMLAVALMLFPWPVLRAFTVVLPPSRGPPVRPLLGRRILQIAVTAAPLRL